MIDVGTAFKEGVVAQSRRISIKAIIDIVPREVVYGSVTGSTQSVYSKSAQIHDHITTSDTRAISSELNRWLIDEPFNAYTRLTAAQAGFETYNTFDANGDGNFYVDMTFSSVNILQACHLYFPDNTTDGYPVNFVFEIRQGDSLLFSQTYRNNEDHDLIVTGFTVRYPTSIRITVTKWSLPNRRMRIPEIWLGMHDEWLDDMFASFNIQQRSSFTAYSVPYATCAVAIDNSKLLFDPTNKQSMFLSLEDRQPIELFMSVNGSPYYTIGTYYHYSGGWKTGNSALSMTWNLVDLIGLLAARKIDTTGLTLPTTLAGWVEMLVTQLGSEFSSLYEVPSAYASISLTTTMDKIRDHTCGEILQWVCQATNTWARADANGKLYVGRFERYGQSSLDLTVKISYDNLEKYPVLKANDDVARIDYKLSDNDSYSVAGTSTSSPTTQSIENPFITSQGAANTNANYALQFYGGNKIETVGRGNPSQEVGDLVYVELSKGTYQPARVIEQTFQVTDHVMKSCQTVLLCVDRTNDYNSFAIFTEGTADSPVYWKVPGNLVVDGTNTGKIKIVLVQAGQTGGHGGWKPVFSWEPSGEADPGSGGRINVMNDVSVTRGLELAIAIGRAVEPATEGTEALDGGHSTVTINGTVFTSQNGQVYSSGLVEPVSAKSLGKPAQWTPAQNSGDGGIGGTVGYTIQHEAEKETEYDYGKGAWTEEIQPTAGTKGADGCVIICFTTTEDI